MSVGRLLPLAKAAGVTMLETFWLTAHVNASDARSNIRTIAYTPNRCRSRVAQGPVCCIRRTAVSRWHQRPDRYWRLELDFDKTPRIARGRGYSYAVASFGERVMIQEMSASVAVRIDATASARVEAGLDTRIVALMSRRRRRQPSRAVSRIDQIFAFALWMVYCPLSRIGKISIVSRWTPRSRSSCATSSRRGL